MTNLFIRILDWVQSFVGNYGWSVVVFTLLIKLVLLPLDVKSRKSMRAMSLLNPKLEELKKRYANDQEKLNKKMSELYKKEKVSPLSGCLPLLIQLPILYIMFAAMRHVAARMQFTVVYNFINNNLVDGDGNLMLLENIQPVIESLKNGTLSFGDTQSWLWIKSVFQPDNFSRVVFPTISELTTALKQYPTELSEEAMQLITVYANNTNGIAEAIDSAVAANCNYFSFNLFLNWFPINWPRNWSNYVNGYYILPVLALATQILTNKLQPMDANAGADQNQNSTGKFMKWFFPILSLWICTSSNAAFSIYWVFVNVWSIASNFIINKYLEHQDKRAKKDGDSSSDTMKEALQP